MTPLHKIVEAALDYGFMCEVACGTERPSMAMLAKYVADWPEIKEGHALYLRAKAQREAVLAESESATRTVADFVADVPDDVWERFCHSRDREAKARTGKLVPKG